MAYAALATAYRELETALAQANEAREQAEREADRLAHAAADADQAYDAAERECEEAVASVAALETEHASWIDTAGDYAEKWEAAEAASAAMRAALEECEFGDCDDDHASAVFWRCPVCEQDENAGHNSDCIIGQALAPGAGAATLAEWRQWHGLRPEVQAMAVAMEQRLKANDHKGGWKHEPVNWLMSRLLAKADDLDEATWPGNLTPEGVWMMAADVCNYAMMIADVCGALSAPQAGKGE
jgi:chromosome segregation ATPase